jgi:hypothetical protein
VLLRDVIRPRIIRGRAPNASVPEEVALGEAFARDNHLDVGDRFPVRGFTPAQVARMTSGKDPGPVAGPLVALRVVGISRSPFDLTLQSESGGVFLLPRAFVEKYGDRFGNWYGPDGGALLVRLRDGPAGVPRFVARFRHLVNDGTFDVDPPALSVGGVQESIDVLASATAIFAIVAAAGGIVAFALVARRETAVVAATQAEARALGLPPGRRVVATALPVLCAAAFGTVIALGVAWLASPLFPFGVARDAEPTPGLRFDTFALGIGAIGFSAVTAFVTVAAAWRATRGTVVTRRRRVLRAPGRARRRLAPPVDIGIAMAFERGSGATSAPVASALAGAVIAIVGVTGAAVFGASLTHLVATPKANGQPWDATIYDTNSDLAWAGDQCGPTGTDLVHDADVAAAASACFVNITVNDRGASGIAITPIRGSLAPTMLSGRAPRSSDEIALGTDTLHALHVDLGDEVTVPSQKGPLRYRVVGRAIVPRLDDAQAIADGAVFSPSGITRIPRSSGDSAAAVVVRFRAGADVDAASRRIDAMPGIGFAGQRGVIHVPLSLEVRRLDQIDGIPRVLAGFLGVVGTIAVGHLLVTSVRRRRRDFAVLKSLGFRPRELQMMVAAQAMTVAAVGVAVGTVIGVVAGARTWRAAAGQVGVLPHVEVPVVALVGIALATAVVGNLVAAVPARAAARTRAAVVLRAE